VSGLPFAPVKPVRGGRPFDDLFNQLAQDEAWVAQAKLDGQRAIWDGKTLWSRRELPITRAPKVLEALAGLDVTLDGEFVPDKGQPTGTYWVFDLPDHRGNLEERWAALRKLMSGFSGISGIELAPSGVDWTDVVKMAWEGLVFKRRDSRYVKAINPGKTVASWVKYRAEWL